MHPQAYPAHTATERCGRCGARHDRWSACARTRLDLLDLTDPVGWSW